MECSHIKKLLVIDIFGKLTQSQKDELRKHIENCRSCADLVRRSKAYSGLLTENIDIPVPNWEHSWQNIRKRTFLSKKRIDRPAMIPYRKWILAAVTCCFIFFIGFMIGKHTFLNHPQQAVVQSVDELLSAYSENIQMLFIDFTNSRFENRNEETTLFEAEIISVMMQQTRMLKYLASQKKLEDLAILLEDIEFILVSISNLRPEDRDSRSQLNQLIRQGSLRVRLQALSQNMTTI